MEILDIKVIGRCRNSRILLTLAEKSGMPKGVLNLIHGIGNKSGNYIVNHDKII